MSNQNSNPSSNPSASEIAQMKAQLEALMAENRSLRQKDYGVSAKGAVQFKRLRPTYGGLALYLDEIETLKGAMASPVFAEFVETNRSLLKSKGDSKENPEAAHASVK